MKAHKLINDLSNPLLKNDHQIDSKLILEIISDIESSQKIDFGIVDYGIIGKSPIKDSNDFNVPFNLIYVEFELNGNDNTSIFFSQLIVKDDDRYSVFTFMMDIYKIYRILPLKISTANDGLFLFSFFGSGYEDHLSGIKDIASKCLDATSKYLNVLNCSNIELVNNTPSKLKQKLSKLPLFEYKTLHIKTNTKRNIQKGNGTHASPRVHLRRGHIRKLESGNIWVQPCVVGNKENGIIHKDYKVVN